MWAVWYTEGAALLVNLSSSLPGPPQLLTSGNRLRLKTLRQSPTTSQSTRSSSINVAPVNQTIILGLQIFLDHRSSRVGFLFDFLEILKFVEIF